MPIVYLMLQMACIAFSGESLVSQLHFLRFSSSSTWRK